MQDDPDQAESVSRDAAAAGQTPVRLAPEALARRHYLLKGLGKGAAVAAAAAPITTLAGPSLLTFDGKHQCSVSGMQSGVMSASPTATICGGYSPGWWGQSVNNTPPLVPKNWPALPSPYTYNTKAVVLLTACTLVNDNGTKPTLFEIVEPQDPYSKFQSTDEFHWVCAWLNAVAQASGSYPYTKFNFPYTPSQVIAFYNAGRGSDTYNNALTFFKTYMENHLSA